jgi:DNA-directed RNA polymerase specialized sigma24 family protein
MVNERIQLSVQELAERCREEANRFRRQENGPTGACFELFRRAIVEGCQEAWKAIYTQYQRQVMRWIGSIDDAEDLVHCAFDKFSRAVKPEAFGRFMGIGTVLAYLKRCARSVCIDRERQIEREQLALDALRPERSSQESSLEQVALNQIVIQQCVEHIYSRVKDGQEELVVRLNLALGWKPAEIVERHPAEFPTQRDVYKVRDRLIRRFSQDPVLRDLWSTAFEKRS